LTPPLPAYNHAPQWWAGFAAFHLAPEGAQDPWKQGLDGK